MNTVNTSRRSFLKGMGLAGLGGTVLGGGVDRALASGGPHVSADSMGVLVDLTLCNGCRRCEAACQEAAGFEPLTAEELKDRSAFDHHRPLGPQGYTTVNRYPGPAGDPENEAIYVKSNCLHCLDPACVSACIVGALRKGPTGAVVYDSSRCMGCRYCMIACPFQMPTYEYDNVLTPQVRKCTMCQNTGNPNKGGVPACVQACPKECLTYGKRSELLARAHEKIEKHPGVYIDHVYGEHEAGGTAWLYLSKVPFEGIDFLKVGPQAPPRLSESIQHGVFKYFMPPVAWCGILGLAMWLGKPDSGEGLPAPQADGDGNASVNGKG